MYSDVSITDFDSDEDVAAAAKRVSDSDHESLTGSVSDASTLKIGPCRVYEFGNFEDNYGWIQCQSKSYPDRVYFHNTNSGCNTWYRPVSRYNDIPFVSVGRRINDTDDAPANDLELMSVSDEEKESDVSAVARNRDRSWIEASDVIARCYYTPQVDLTCDTDESGGSVDASTNDEYLNENKQMDVTDGNNNIGDNDLDVPETKCSPHELRATDFLDIELFVGEGEVNTERTTRTLKSPLNDNSSDDSSLSPPRARYVVYRVPRLKKITPEDQFIKPTRTRVSKTPQGPKKIICDMYGVRTISYDLPEPEERVRTEVEVKMSTLSGSDSDTSKSSFSRHAKTTQLFGSEWRDIEKNLHQPLLSDSSSSSSSSWSDTNSSSTSNSSTTCSCSTCSSRSTRS